MRPRTTAALLPFRLAWPALLVACTPVPASTTQPAAPVDVAVATPAPPAPPAVTRPAATPRPPQPACTTLPIASTWQPPVSASKPRPIIEQPKLPARGRAALALARRILARRCPKLDVPTLDVDNGAWEGNQLGAQPLGPNVLMLHALVSGNGVTAEYGATVTRHDLVACTTTAFHSEYYDWGLTGRVFGDPPASLLTQVIGPAYDPKDPAHAYATMLTTTGPCALDDPPDLADDAPRAGAPDFTLLPLPFSAQPWFPGRPRAQARVWRPVQEVDEPMNTPIVARIYEPPSPPRRLRVLDTLEIFGADIPGRNGGLALALYDPSADRHRWLLFTRGCLQGTFIHWLAAGSGLVVAYAVSNHPVYQEEGYDGLFVVDLGTGRTYKLLLSGASLLWELPEAQDEHGRPVPGLPPPKPGDVGDPVLDPTSRQIGRLRQDATTLRTRCGAEVPLSAIRAAIDAGTSAPDIFPRLALKSAPPWPSPPSTDPTSPLNPSPPTTAH